MTPRATGKVLAHNGGTRYAEKVYFATKQLLYITRAERSASKTSSRAYGVEVEWPTSQHFNASIFY